MADSNKDKATPSTPATPSANAASTNEKQAPGNGDVWGTVPDVKNSEAKDAGAAGDAAGDAAGTGNVSDAADTAAAATAPGDTDAASADEILDAVLEAEAAAIVDNAMDEARAEAAAKVAEAEADAADASADASAKEAAEWKDKYMRLHAEWDTYRRRQKEQAATQKALAAEKLVSSLIPVIDDIERSIDYAQKNGETGLLSGVEAVLAKFVDTLKKDGVEVIDPKGEAFEALEAQAVGTVEDASVPEETVADVYQRGYKIGTKVLRPAMVTVTTGGPRREKPAEQTEE